MSEKKVDYSWLFNGSWDPISGPLPDLDDFIFRDPAYPLRRALDVINEARKVFFYGRNPYQGRKRRSGERRKALMTIFDFIRNEEQWDPADWWQGDGLFPRARQLEGGNTWVVKFSLNSVWREALAMFSDNFTLFDSQNSTLKPLREILSDADIVAMMALSEATQVLKKVLFDEASEEDPTVMQKAWSADNLIVRAESVRRHRRLKGKASTGRSSIPAALKTQLSPREASWLHKVFEIWDQHGISEYLLALADKVHRELHVKDGISFGDPRHIKEIHKFISRKYSIEVTHQNATHTEFRLIWPEVYRFERCSNTSLEDPPTSFENFLNFRSENDAEEKP